MQRWQIFVDKSLAILAGYLFLVVPFRSGIANMTIVTLDRHPPTKSQKIMLISVLLQSDLLKDLCHSLVANDREA